MPKDFLSLIKNQMSTFSKGQKLIANYILDCYDKAAFMTASKLGKTVNVSESTVVRFAAELGFDGYPAMQKALQEMIRNKLTSIQRIEASNDLFSNHDILASVMQSDMENIRLTLEESNKKSFDESVQAIISAQNIYILGVRSSATLADFLAFYFSRIFGNVIHVGAKATAASEIFEQIVRIGEGDVIIGLSFPRYSQRTVKALRFAKDRGAIVIAITDSADSSVSKYATHLLLAKSEMVSFVDSLVAPMSMINALLVAVARQKNEEVSQIFEQLEKIWSEYNVFVNLEDDV